MKESISLPYVLFIGAAVLISFHFISGSMWFYQLWIGVVIGTFFWTIGEIACRYLKNRSLLHALDMNNGAAITNKIVFKLVVVSLFSAVAAFGLIPSFSAAHYENEMLSKEPIHSIAVISQSSGKRITISEKDIEEMRKGFKKSVIFFPSHEGPTEEFFIEIAMNDKAVVYDADVPEGHPDDVRLSFKRVFLYSNILVPGLGKQLKEHSYLDGP